MRPRPSSTVCPDSTIRPGTSVSDSGTGPADSAGSVSKIGADSSTFQHPVCIAAYYAVSWPRRTSSVLCRQHPTSQFRPHYSKNALKEPHMKDANLPPTAARQRPGRESRAKRRWWWCGWWCKNYGKLGNLAGVSPTRHSCAPHLGVRTHLTARHGRCQLLRRKRPARLTVHGNVSCRDRRWRWWSVESRTGGPRLHHPIGHGEAHPQPHAIGRSAR